MTISVAIIGAGRMGCSHHDDLAMVDDVRLVGVADTQIKSAEALAARTGTPAYADYRELLDHVRPDVAYLCTPAAAHLEQIRFAAERGINVFVEKPIATSVSDAIAAAKVVQDTGVLCSVGYQWRHSPSIDIAREVIGDAPITLLAGWWYWTVPLVSWIRNKRWGGGQIFDQATHLIDLMRYLVGDVSTMHAAYANNAVPQTELPNWDANALTLRFANGAVGSVHTTYALFPGIPNSNGLDVVTRDLLVRLDLHNATIFRPHIDPVHSCASPGWNITGPFIEAIRHNTPSTIRATADEAAKSVIVTLAANYAAITGGAVNVDDFTVTPPEDCDIMPTGLPPTPVGPSTLTTKPA